MWVYKGLLDYALGYLNTNNHGIFLHWFDCLEVICREGYGQDVGYSVPGDYIDRPNLL